MYMFICVWWLWWGRGGCQELPARSVFLWPQCSLLSHSLTNSWRRRAMWSHVLRINNISMGRLSCRWYCLQRFMQFLFMALYCAVKWKWCTCLPWHLHPLTRCMRGEGGNQQNRLRFMTQIDIFQYVAFIKADSQFIRTPVNGFNEIFFAARYLLCFT